MKKKLKILTFTLNLLIISSNTLLTASCSFWETNVPNRDTLVSMLHWQIPSKYHNFVVKYENKIKERSSEFEKNDEQFKNLYDGKNPTPNIWQTYDNLENDLTKNSLNNDKHIINVNWNKMYQIAGLNNNKLLLTQVEAAQLRFYNIIAKIYHKQNILHLIQTVSPLISFDEQTIALTQYNSTINDQKMAFDSRFVNTNLIDEQYQDGFWSSDNIDSVTIHEYGHALSNFIGLNDIQRQKLNTTKWNSLQKKSNPLKIFSNTNQNYSLTSNFNIVINNRANHLMKYLNQTAKISHNKGEQLLFPLIVVRSNYGRIAWSGNPNPNLQDEFFAEAFAQWLLTPEQLRTWNWELLNNYFINVLPQAANL